MVVQELPTFLIEIICNKWVIVKNLHIFDCDLTRLTSHPCAPTAMKYLIEITVLWICLYEYNQERDSHKNRTNHNSLVEQNNEVINHDLVKTNLDDLQKIVKTAVPYLVPDSTTNHSKKIRQRTYSSHTTNVARRACSTAQ